MSDGKATPAATAPLHSRTRDRYIDTLRAVALIRVVINHAYGWVWLPFVFPSMGIMFALAGSLMAQSLDRSNDSAHHTILKRMRRLLPPMWIFGLFIVPLMLLAGWTFNPYMGSAPLTWGTLFFWILPISEPPGSEWGIYFVEPLWYITTYVWLVLLSPLLLWSFRRWPLPTLLIPMAVSTALVLGVFEVEGRVERIITYISTYAPCWMLGFAHHDNRIRPIPMPTVLIAAVLLMAGGTLWAFGHPDEFEGVRIDVIPFAQMLYCLGGVALLLRFYPSFEWLKRFPPLDNLVSAINARAVTIYLWGGVAVGLAEATMYNNRIADRLYDNTVTAAIYNWMHIPIMFIFTGFFLAIAVFTLGWVEDVAARRTARFVPLR